MSLNLARWLKINLFSFIFIFGSVSGAYAAASMADYCYLPPFVTDVNTPPNIMLIFEKGSGILKRAYNTSYDADRTYYGFFDPTSYYTYDAANNYFYKNTCLPSPTNLNCIQGNYLDWAMMSAIDLSRKALVGFGWPNTGSGTGAGDVFTYSGNFCSAWSGGICTSANIAPVSYGQWQDGNSTSVNVPINLNGTDYYYTFCLSKFSGSNPTGLSVRVRTGSAVGCSGGNGVTNLVSNGQVAMKFTDERRTGVIQKYADKDRNYIYDKGGPRFGLRRWNNGTDKQVDIMRDSPALSASEGQTLFQGLLTAISKAPPDDPSTPYLQDMMKDIVAYFKQGSATYIDNDSTTQTPYNWSTDPALKCRKTYALFITTGDNIDSSAAPLSSSCTGTTSSNFSENTCYAYKTDLYTTDGTPPMQNIRTFIVQTSFYDPSSESNSSALMFAASPTVSGGMYYDVSDPTTLEATLDAVILNIISSSSSASTVATLTSQTRESSTLTQAYFYPQFSDSNLRWIGYLRLLWSDPAANVREDSSSSGWLDLKYDNILSFFYDPSAVAYKARIYQPQQSPPYLNIANCDPSPSAAGNTTKTNDQITPIWNAQDKLFNRSTDDRTIKIGIGDSSGNVTSSTCSGNSGFCDFTTSLNTTLQPFWNAGGYCSNNTSRWCAVNSNCNSCAANPATRSCPSGTNAECSYCSGNASVPCSADTDCTFSYGTCSAGTCSGDAGRSCTADTDCVDNFGTCTTDTCNVADGTTVKCNQECDNNCATSVIKYVRGYDKPTPSGGNFRVRHQCVQDSDCLSGTCQADNTCSISDNIKTYKLGDIVYSTPRMSPNSFVNGYASIYQDQTYKSFIDNTISSATPMVVVGGNDGMVHAFKVSKIKDFQPALTTSTTTTVGYSIARFADNVSEQSDAAPPADLGRELWGYIPYNVIPYLHWYCSKGYCHIPMLDARFTITDASINTANPTDIKTASTWRRLLIGAMGVGGKQITIGNTTFSSSIFVLDITDPASPVLLWEKPLPDGTLTTSVPAVVRLASDASDASKNEAGSWYLVIGSGPVSVLTNAVTYKSGTANLYVFNLKTGNLAATLPVTGTSGVAVGDTMTVDFDSDYQVDDIYFGTYGGTGSGPGSTQTGNLYRLRIRNGDIGYLTNPTGWAVSHAVDAGRPIYASPEVAVDSDENPWIYFGTGLYLTLEHAEETTDNEYMFGFKETKTCWKGTGSCSTYSNFLDSTHIGFSGAAATELGCFCGGTEMTTIMCNPAGQCPSTSCGANKACSNNLAETCSTDSDCPGGSCIENKVVLKVANASLSGSGVPAECSGMKDENAIACLESQIKTMDGWKRAVSGQKMFARPFVAGGLVDFTAFEPDSRPCSLGGSTYLVSLQYTTGTSYFEPSIATYDATTGGYSNLTLNPSVKLGTGVPPLGESLVALPLAGDAYKIITQVSGGLPGLNVTPSASATRGYVMWRSR